MNNNAAVSSQPELGSFNDLSNPANRPGYVTPGQTEAHQKLAEATEAMLASLNEVETDRDRDANEGRMVLPWKYDESGTRLETAPVTREATGSAVVQLLEKVWARIRQNHPELPAVVIVTGAGLSFGGGKWGHFRANGWATKVAEEGAATSSRLDEMFMAGETLAKGARQVLQTMLHEGAHTLAKVREVQETSRQGRWHNAKFRTLAEEMGLEYKSDQADKAIGFSQVTLTDATVEEYADLMTELDAEIHLMVSLPGWLGGDAGQNGGENMGKAPKGPAAPNTNNVKATCLCEEPNIVRMSRKVLDRRVVHCEDCNSLFDDRS
jgi:hypothetical protein